MSDCAFQIAAFYQFVPLDVERVQANLLATADTLGVTGVVIVAPEGINGTVAAPELDEFLNFLETEIGVDISRANRSACAEAPFRRMSVRAKPEVVPTGRKEAIEGAERGTYVEPEAWDALIRQDDVTVIDCRNSYEFEVGTFEGAIDPGTDCFREFADWVDELDPSEHQRVAMFCTGGIRCEKATAYLVERGFPEVYHLKGGILGYLNKRGKYANTWQGECFVFDRRVSVDADLETGTHSLCWACRMPLLEAHYDSPLYEDGVSCPRCYERFSEAERASKRERHRQFVARK